jgi:serine/threonine-protein kinase
MSKPSPHDAGCPGREELAAFDQGRLALADLQPVADHVAHCGRCQHLLQNLSRQIDPFLAYLQQDLAGEPLLREPELVQLEVRARKILLEETPPHGPADTKLPAQAQWRLEGKIGQGSRGTVFRARQRDVERVAAVKLLPFGLANNVARQQRFMAEVTLASYITHGRILPVVDIAPTRPGTSLTMPLVEGTDLGEIIVQRKRFLAQGRTGSMHPLAGRSESDYVRGVLDVLDQLVNALAEVHSVGLAHGDVKPSNCLVDSRDRLWVTDFGISRLTNHWGAVRIDSLGEEFLEWDGGVDPPEVRIAAPGFVSPEQWSGHADADPIVDVFALGATLYQALTLHLPYGTAPLTRRRPRPTAPSLWAPLIPPALDGVILRALHTERERRYPSAVALQADWRRARGSGATSSPASETQSP